MNDAPTREDLARELENAPEAPPIDGAPPMPPPPPPPQDRGPGGGSGDRPRGEIFEGCPVKPLGVCGDLAYFLDANGQLRAAKKMENQVLQSLFGHQINKLRRAFPIFVNNAEKGEPPIWQIDKKKVDFQYASLVIWEAVSECGVFNPQNAVRGVGAWTDDQGHLVYHTGNAILYRGERYVPGRIGPHIYPAAPPIPHPADNLDAPDPVPPLMQTLESWNWSRPDLHPFVALGMISIQMLCGALDWRPVFWLIAAAGSGKSEFQKLLKQLHGDGGLVQSTDATQRGITSQLGQSSLPVALDELEPGDERSTKEKSIIELARIAASGGSWLRSSADQTGVTGKIYSAFLFSSVLIPGAMKTQDLQRLIRLEMEPLTMGAPKLNLDPRTWGARGRRLKAMLIQRWDTWPERQSMWRHALELAGVMGRDADNWSAVLAMADMAQSEDLPTQEICAAWAQKVAFQVTADKPDVGNDAEAMLLHLMSQTLDPFRRGEQWTIAQWIMAAAGLPAAPRALLEKLPDQGIADTRTDRMKAANGVLAGVGLRVYYDDAEPSLFIMNKQIQGLKDIFRFSDWAGGVWSQSAKRVPGAVATPSPATLAGISSRGYKMPLKSIPGLMSFPMDQGAGAAPRVSDELEDWK
ncbi:hypothetical protein KZZ08_00595 [Roseovarius mucosus]|uniref:hypothetical protein n=1 Tax=Roseovarius mucosus TaxID=215743 RepID=UPI001C5DCC5C|nr:hypothetical protein [Roseovarius mucosus]MBW4972094.1 hypothetical protein [Roseovarius mucosus]